MEADSPAILGFHGAALLSSQPKQTIETLRDDLGLVLEKEDETATHLITVGEENIILLFRKKNYLEDVSVLGQFIILLGQCRQMKNIESGKIICLRKVIM